MITSTSFSYANRHSDDFGVSHIRVGGGLVEDTFLHTTSVQYKKSKNRHKIIIESTEEEPLVIPMALYFNDGITNETFREVKKWLTQSNPQPLVFEDQSDRIYYAIRNSSSPIRHNGGLHGYIEVEMLTTSPYAFGGKLIFEGQSTTSTTNLQLLNDSDLMTPTTLTLVMPETNMTDIQITNLTTAEMMTLKNNLSNETVIFHGEYEEIETSSDMRYGYDDHNNVFINLAPGMNEIEFTGNFSYKIEYQPILL